MTDETIMISSLGDACCGCGACAAKCPKGCISMEADVAGFARPVIDADACVGCRVCESVCPALAAVEGLAPARADEALSVHWAKDRSSELLEASSSGGVFGLFARRALAEGGVVCGAAWDEGCRRVRHVLVEDVNGLDAVMRSKYVQSEVGREIYEGLRAALREGRKVLFAGTACQVAGMRAYLGRLADSNRFLSVDVICHGVPSPRLWSEWAAYKESRAGSSLRDVNMRSKTTGWLSYSAAYKYAVEKDGTGPADSQVFGEDWYMKAFLANASLRPSCFACPAKRGCGSDVTLGDFWGFQNIHPEVDYSKGVSAVICNTGRGEAAVAEVADELETGEATLDQVLMGNSSLVSPVAPYARRDEFMDDLEGGVGIEGLMAKYDFKPSLWQRVHGKFGSLKRRVMKLLKDADGER